MNKNLYLLCVILSLPINAMNNKHANDMCTDVSRLLQAFAQLKSHSLSPVKNKDIQLLDTRNRIIDNRSPNLRKIKNACDKNTHHTFLSQWNDTKFVAETTLANATAITELLNQKSSVN